MRKLYTLLAGLVLAMTYLPANARTLTPDHANFTFTIDAVNRNVVFANTSVIGTEPGIRRAHWSFGDGTGQWTGASDGTQHHYQSPGTYTVCLKIIRVNSNTNDSTVSSEICKTIVIESICHAGFETVAASTTPLGRQFIAQPSHNQNKKPVRICWSFGDNTDTCIQYSTTYTGVYGIYHQYSQAGSYNVCVNILYDGGCEAQNCHSVIINGPDSCRADFERIPITTSNNPLQVLFKALPWHSNDKRPVLICWKFGDNRDTCIQYSNTNPGPYTVTHTYSNPGNYEVCVKILYQGGCEARKCRVIETGRQDSCRADFERIPFTSASNVVATGFRALPWHSNNKKPSRICWSFGDNRDTCINYGQDYTGQYTVNHIYQQAGQYEVCVKILYYGGCEAAKCRVVGVNHPDSCRADFERVPITTSNNVLTTAFRALPWNSNNRKPARICWTFGDNRDTCINYGQDYNGSYVVNHTYQQAGQYEVCVKILYYGGCEARKCKIVPIPENRCAVTIFELTPSINRLTRILYAVVASSPPHPVQSICWKFGDGTDTCITVTSSTPPSLLITHTYPGPGVYRACVRVVFQGGCVAENCKEVVIRSNSHLCGGYMTDSLVGVRTIKFKGFAIHNPDDPVIGYRWNFGDGSIATGPEVTHTYNTGGQYRVCLNILTHSGCETRICNNVRVPGANHAILQLSPNPVVNVLHASFLSNHNENVTIKIVNSSGVIVRTYTRYANAGINNWDFDLSGLLTGTYLFTVQSPNQLASAIFMKQ